MESAANSVAVSGEASTPSFPGVELVPAPPHRSVVEMRERRKASGNLPHISSSPTSGSKEEKLHFVSRAFSYLQPEVFPDESDLYWDFIEMTQWLFDPLWQEAQRHEITLERQAKRFVTSLHNFATQQWGRNWGSGKGVQSDQRVINSFLLMERERAAECICLCSTMFLVFALWWLDLFPHVITFMTETLMVSQAGHILLIDSREDDATESFETTHPNICQWGWQRWNWNRRSSSTFFAVGGAPDDAIALAVMTATIGNPRAREADFMRQFVLPYRSPNLEEMMLDMAGRSFHLWNDYLTVVIQGFPELDADERADWLGRMLAPHCLAVSGYLALENPPWGPIGPQTNGMKGWSIFVDRLMWQLTINLIVRSGLPARQPTEPTYRCLLHQLYDVYPAVLAHRNLFDVMPPPSSFAQVSQQEIAALDSDTQKLLLAVRQLSKLTLPDRSAGKWRVSDFWPPFVRRQIDDEDEAESLIVERLTSLTAGYREAVESAVWRSLFDGPLPEDRNLVSPSLELWLQRPLLAVIRFFAPPPGESPSADTSPFWDGLTASGIPDELVAAKPMVWDQVVYLMILVPLLMQRFPLAIPVAVNWLMRALDIMKNVDDLNAPWRFFLDPELRHDWIEIMINGLDAFSSTAESLPLLLYVASQWIPDLLSSVALQLTDDQWASVGEAVLSTQRETVLQELRRLLSSLANRLDQRNRMNLALVIRDTLNETLRQGHSLEGFTEVLYETDLLI